MWKLFNPNPAGRIVGDCSVRALAKALGIPWEEAYARACSSGFLMGDMPSSDSVWGAVLRQNGFSRNAIPNTCPDCYTIGEFAAEHPRGTYVVGTGRHVVAVVDGNVYDSWDSRDEVPVYYWSKGEE